VTSVADEERADFVAERVAAIFSAAEEAAEAMREEASELLAARRAEAEREAARISDEARAAAQVLLEDARRRAEEETSRQVREAKDLSRTLVDHATALLRSLDGAEAMKSSVRDLVDKLDTVAAGLGSGNPEQPPQEARRGSGKLEPIEEARLMALQMAMAGRARSEVEEDLRHGYRIDDPGAVLDDIFGRGTPGTQRIPWSGPAKSEPH
jgi:F0F1-type ATP synthase membrane subunit b/b'